MYDSSINYHFRGSSLTHVKEWLVHAMTQQEGIVSMSDQVNDVDRSIVPERVKSREGLDELVGNMELTLMSIIQGVALFFLTDSARTPLLTGQISSLPYVVVGLLIILLFWSRSLIHTFTVIRWPLEFGHNYVYIACTLTEAILFTQLNNVRNWYLVATVYAAIVWLLFVFDLRMIRLRLAESRGPAGKRLFGTVLREQLLHTRIGLPIVTGFYGVAAALALTQPAWFIDQNGHSIFAISQLVVAFIYLAYVLHFYRSLSPLILNYRQEEREINRPGADGGDIRGTRQMKQ
jgi:hypothetical protein